MSCLRYILKEDGGKILLESGDGALLHQIQLPQFVLTESGGKILQESGEQILLEVQNAVPVCLTGVSASPAIGSGRFDADVIFSGVAATPAIGEGTVIIEPAGAVFVYLVGVSADPQIGTGTVEGAEPETIPGGGRPVKWKPYPFKPQVMVFGAGVKARPRIGRGKIKIAPAVIVYAESILAGPIIGRPQLRILPPPSITIRRKKGVRSNPGIGVNSAFDATIILKESIKAAPRIRSGTIGIEIELMDDEIIAILAA